MAKIYLGRLEIADELRSALSEAGFEVLSEDPPEEPAAEDLALVKARDGCTSTLRHGVLNAMTTVLGFTELLQRSDGLPEGSDHKLARIREYGERVKELIRRHEND